MKILIFADLHTFDVKNLDLITEDFNFIVTLGDIKTKYLREIMLKFEEKNIYGILGNHDDRKTLDSVNERMKIEKEYGFYNGHEIENINLRLKNTNKIKIIGIEGCLKYKPFQPGFTQNELLGMNIENADIIFSHDTGYGYMEKQDFVHVGLKGISKYIEEKSPKYHIFGHYHINTEFLINNTRCYCVYGCSIFDYCTGEMKNIF